MLRELILSIPYIQHIGYLLVFLTAFLETLPGIGLFIPGQTMVAIGGFLADQGVLRLWFVLIIAILAAFSGDLTAFMLGKQYGTRVFVAKKKGVLATVKKLLRKHPIKTLIFGRFNSLTRSFAPFAAGASKVPKSKFLLANAIGAVLWATTWCLLGFLVGASYSAIAKWIDIIIVLCVVLLIAVFVIYRFLKKQHLLDTRIGWMLIASALGLIMFSATVESVEHGVAQPFDAAVNMFMPHVWTPVLTVIMLFFTSLIQPLVITAFTLGFAFLLIGHGDRKHSALFVATMVGAAVIDFFLKAVIMRPRPLGSLIAVSDYSFPSGHAFLATVFFGAALLTYTRWIPWKRGFKTLCIATALLVCLSRLYLGVHWLSDVVGGFALGVFWLTFCFLSYDGIEFALKKRQKY